MKVADHITHALHQIDRSMRVRGVIHTIKLALRVFLTEGPKGIKRRLDALGPVLRDTPAPAEALILTMPHTLHFAHRLKAILAECGIMAGISDNDRKAKEAGLVFAFAPQNFPAVPPERMVAFQVEQHAATEHWTPGYLRRLEECRAVWDFSTENISLLRRTIPLHKIYYVPFSPLPAVAEARIRRGVLFYGNVNTPRRREALARIKDSLPELVVESNLFGPAIEHQLRQAAIIVNIHAIEGAVLETARISESLAAGAVVVSETALDQDNHPEILSRTVFVNEGDIDSLADRLCRLLNNPDEMKALRDAATHPVPDRFRHGVLRALQGLNLISPERFDELVTDYPSLLEGQSGKLPRICLTLPETPERTHAFQAHHNGYQLWQGLKAEPGWRGCALSYRHMFRSLSAAGISEALIVEDDVVLPNSFERHLETIRAAMRDADADMFSGLIVDLHKDSRILDVEHRDGLTLIHLDRAVMMICNLYRTRMIEYLAAWNHTDTNAFSNTIDRYMEQATHLRVITTLPFLAAYRPELHSTLRENDNRSYDVLRLQSEAALAQKVREFEALHGTY